MSTALVEGYAELDREVETAKQLGFVPRWTEGSKVFRSWIGTGGPNSVVECNGAQWTACYEDGCKVHKARQEEVLGQQLTWRWDISKAVALEHSFPRGMELVRRGLLNRVAKGVPEVWLVDQVERVARHGTGDDVVCFDQAFVVLATKRTADGCMPVDILLGQRVVEHSDEPLAGHRSTLLEWMTLSTEVRPCGVQHWTFESKVAAGGFWMDVFSDDSERSEVADGGDSDSDNDSGCALYSAASEKL
ncbi:hypothetical protein LX36DRAFT_665088 [Colletotrichum falcatum]|nr:hypothetical protein LX36DRAFT_665088 [Colletotrichum falcatum]